MVGRLNLQDIPGDPLDMKRKAERVLDSPDSGLPPSPSPSAWLLSPVNGEKELLEPETSGRAVVGYTKCQGTCVLKSSAMNLKRRCCLPFSFEMFCICYLLLQLVRCAVVVS